MGGIVSSLLRGLGLCVHLEYHWKILWLLAGRYHTRSQDRLLHAKRWCPKFDDFGVRMHHVRAFSPQKFLSWVGNQDSDGSARALHFLKGPEQLLNL